MDGPLLIFFLNTLADIHINLELPCCDAIHDGASKKEHAQVVKIDFLP